MRWIFATTVFLLFLWESEAGGTCTRSRDCGTGECCRDVSGNVFGTDQEGRWGMLPTGTVKKQATCSTKLAQKGEFCDFSCKCDQGLECYRPMSGFCCPPRRCYDADYVKKQNEYWANCRPPTCFFPAK